MPEARSPSPRGVAELKSGSVAGLTLDSVADPTLETPAELMSYWPADLRRLPHPGCRLVWPRIGKASNSGASGRHTVRGGNSLHVQAEASSAQHARQGAEEEAGSRR